MVIGADCDNTYATPEYGAGKAYGPSSCLTADELFLDIDTPARDLVQISMSVEFITDTTYLTPENYVIIDLETGKQLGIRKVQKPQDQPTSSIIQLVLDKHVAGTEYSITVSNIIQRNGAILLPTTSTFFARDSKANSMLAALPNHFNADPKESVLRQVLQALAESDDRIGSL